ncbi:hypothetical protein [Nesterenkonia sp. PF2B19]|uniref:hypothetical protein n=2 Tax=unclassified Nesterenkonia TaxID=2629769 RepID=UPI00111C718A|nr:hypothetical protein [Nesterenkonia sp. PF2B19]
MKTLVSLASIGALSAGMFTPTQVDNTPHTPPPSDFPESDKSVALDVWNSPTGQARVSHNPNTENSSVEPSTPQSSGIQDETELDELSANDSLTFTVVDTDESEEIGSTVDTELHLALNDGLGSTFKVTSHPAGMEFNSVVSGSDEPTAPALDLDITSEAELIENPEGYLLEADEGTVAAFTNITASDATGEEVEAWYTWEDGILYQEFNHDQVSDYPVSVSSGWSYSYTFSYGKTKYQASSLVRGCFNCYFPISGAPRNYPSNGQLLPLRVAVIGNFECRMGVTQLPDANHSFFFNFRTTTNHLYGTGHTVNFSFGDRSVLTVYASTPSWAAWTHPGARSQWSTFASNVRNG